MEIFATEEKKKEEIREKKELIGRLIKDRIIRYIRRHFLNNNKKIVINLKK